MKIRVTLFRYILFLKIVRISLFPHYMKSFLKRMIRFKCSTVILNTFFRGLPAKSTIQKNQLQIDLTRLCMQKGF
jgi:hypothetical protein